MPCFQSRSSLHHFLHPHEEDGTAKQDANSGGKHSARDNDSFSSRRVIIAKQAREASLSISNSDEGEGRSGDFGGFDDCIAVGVCGGDEVGLRDDVGRRDWNGAVVGPRVDFADHSGQSRLELLQDFSLVRDSEITVVIDSGIGFVLFILEVHHHL